MFKISFSCYLQVESHYDRINRKYFADGNTILDTQSSEKIKDVLGNNVDQIAAVSLKQ